MSEILCKNLFSEFQSLMFFYKKCNIRKETVKKIKSKYVGRRYLPIF